MKRERIAFGLTLALFPVVVGCAGTPGPGQPGYPFNLTGTYSGEVMVEGMSFGVSMDLRTGDRGALEGTFQVTSPVAMAGHVTGSVAADTVNFRLDYMNPMDGCGGTLNGTGVVQAGGHAFAGRVGVNDSCAGGLAGSFSMRR